MMFAGGDSGPRLAFRACGEDVRICPRTHVVSPMTISIGDSVIYAGLPARPIKVRRKNRVLELEVELWKVVFDAQGHYMPRDRR